MHSYGRVIKLIRQEAENDREYLLQKSLHDVLQFIAQRGLENKRVVKS